MQNSPIPIVYRAYDGAGGGSFHSSPCWKSSNRIQDEDSSILGPTAGGHGKKLPIEDDAQLERLARASPSWNEPFLAVDGRSFFRLLPMLSSTKSYGGSHDEASSNTTFSLETIGKGSMSQLYKYKSSDHHNSIFRNTYYRARPVKLANRPLRIPGGTLSSDMIGKLVIVKHNKTTTTEQDQYDTYLNWADANHNPRGTSIVNKPIDQGNHCGSCWALATTGSMEAAVALAHPDVNFTKFLRLSVQELLDCDRQGLDEGCAGGNPLLAVDFLHRYGLTSWHRYPYTGDADSICQGRPNGRDAVAKVQAWGMIPPHHEHVIKLAVRYLGPVAVSFRATHPDFLNYQAGVFDVSHCSGAVADGTMPRYNNNHALLITGYGEETTVSTTTGTTTTVPYWIARNSWGESWGERGYVRIRRDKNVCGIAQNPSVALGGIYLKGDDGAKTRNRGPRAALRIAGIAIGAAVLTFVVLFASSISRCCCRKRRQHRHHLLQHYPRRSRATSSTKGDNNEGKANYGAVISTDP
jgi:hypothetical protein